MAESATLSVRDLRVTMDGTPVIHSVSVEVTVGGWVCVIGPNGAGKSTLLRAIAGIVRSQGGLDLAGRDLHAMDARARACWIGYVAQDPVMPAGMRVSDYIMLGRTAHLSLLASESPRDAAITDQVITDLDLGRLRTRDVATLSGGERQRVAIGRALAQASPIVLLDEPTTALDIGYQQEVLELIDRLRREGKIGVLSTMHDLTVAGLYPDSLVLLAHGRAVTQGPARTVLTSHQVEATYGASVRVIDDPRGPIVVPQRADRADGG